MVLGRSLVHPGGSRHSIFMEEFHDIHIIIHLTNTYGAPTTCQALFEGIWQILNKRDSDHLFKQVDRQ